MKKSDLKKLKVEIFQRFKLSETSIKQQPLQNYELDMIYEQFKQYARKDINEALNTDLKNNKEYIFLANKIMDDEIRNHFCRSKTLTANSYIFLANKLDITPRKLEIELRKLRKIKFFDKLGITEDDFKAARKELRKNKIL